jgi:hypothetical protein
MKKEKMGIKAAIINYTIFKDKKYKDAAIEAYGRNCMKFQNYIKSRIRIGSEEASDLIQDMTIQFIENFDSIISGINPGMPESAINSYLFWGRLQNYIKMSSRRIKSLNFSHLIYNNDTVGNDGEKTLYGEMTLIESAKPLIDRPDEDRIKQDLGLIRKRLSESSHAGTKSHAVCDFILASLQENLELTSLSATELAFESGICSRGNAKCFLSIIKRPLYQVYSKEALAGVLP